MIIHELKILSEKVGVLGEIIVMKVKTIGAMNTEQLDEKVNKFIKGKRVMDIKFNGFQDYDGANFVALIMYGDLEI